MSVDSRKIDKLETVDLIVSGYEWICPHCGWLNKEPVECIIVSCIECGDRFRVNEIVERQMMPDKKLTKQEQETYNQCLGQCSICMLDGACELQKKIKGEKDE